jgi:hypothetical protein
MDGRGSSPGRSRYLSLRHHIQTGSRAHTASYPMDTGASSPGIKWPGLEADNSPPSTADANAWSCTAIPPYVFMAWCLVKPKDNFSFYRNVLSVSWPPASNHSLLNSMLWASLLRSIPFCCPPPPHSLLPLHFVSCAGMWSLSVRMIHLNYIRPCCKARAFRLQASAILTEAVVSP